MIKNQTTELEPLAISAPEAAKMLGTSERHFWAMNSNGRIPQPVRFGRSVRWSVDVLRRWLAAGAPERHRWELN